MSRPKISAEELMKMDEAQINELVERARARLRSPESREMLEELTQRMAEIEEEYEGLDRLDVELLRTPMTL